MPQSLAGTTVKDGTARMVRTGQQGGVVWSLLELFLAFDLIVLTPRQTAAVLVVGTAALAKIQTAWENRAGWAFLRELPPKPGQVPLVAEAPKPRRRRSTDAGQGELRLLLVSFAGSILAIVVYVALTRR